MGLAKPLYAGGLGLALPLIVLVSVPGHRDPLPSGPIQDTPMTISELEVSPDLAGMSEERLSAVDSLIMIALADSAAPGAALAIGRRGQLVRLRGYGYHDWEGPRTEVTSNSLFDLASLTKVIATTTAMMILVEEGEVELDTPVVRYLPWWAAGDSSKTEVTVRQLLLHRGGLPSFRRWFAEALGKEEYRRLIGEEPLEYPPGDRTVYSDIGFMTLAFIVEAVSEMPYEAFLEERVWNVFGMNETGFRPDMSKLDRIAPTEVDSLFRGEHVHGVVHDENAYAMGGIAGHAGLFSTATDLAIFASTVLGQGWVGTCLPVVRIEVQCRADGSKAIEILDANTIRGFVERYDDTASRALGWDTPSGNSSAGAYFSGSAFGHTGFTGTSIWMDPELDLFVVLLTNRVNPSRENSKHVALRREVHDGAALSVIDQVVQKRER